MSHPVLTLRTPRVQAVVGDILEIHCETQRGSPPIRYQFYHEDVALGSFSSLSGGGTSFNLSLTTEHSGNYSCEADNGLWVQRSESVSLNVRSELVLPTASQPRTDYLLSLASKTELQDYSLLGNSPAYFLPTEPLTEVWGPYCGYCLGVLTFPTAQLKKSS